MTLAPKIWPHQLLQIEDSLSEEYERPSIHNGGAWHVLMEMHDIYEGCLLGKQQWQSWFGREWRANNLLEHLQMFVDPW